jgi:geranylgeranyl diphosphate synthase type II
LKTSYSENPLELYEPLTVDGIGRQADASSVGLLRQIYSRTIGGVESPPWPSKFFHNFTLMHIGIMDAAPLRRGQPTVPERVERHLRRQQFIGDVMLVAAYELLTRIDDKHFKRVIKRLNHYRHKVCEETQLDIIFLCGMT